MLKLWENPMLSQADQLEAAKGRIEQLEQMLERASRLAVRWRDVVDELPQEAQEVLFVRNGKTVHGAWIGGIFWHNNTQMAAAKWMPLPVPNGNA